MTGRDVSHGIAKWSFDPKHHHDNLVLINKCSVVAFRFEQCTFQSSKVLCGCRMG